MSIFFILPQVEGAGPPDDAIFQVWTDKPDRALPETGATTTTRLVADYIRTRTTVTVAGIPATTGGAVAVTGDVRTLGGEPVVDWSLKFKQQFGAQTWVAGYCNDVMTYIPSLRILKEDVPPLAQPRWGYEGAHAMMVYGLPAFRWADDVEDLVNAGVRRVVARAQAAAN